MKKITVDICVWRNVLDSSNCNKYDIFPMLVGDTSYELIPDFDNSVLSADSEKSALFLACNLAASIFALKAKPNKIVIQGKEKEYFHFISADEALSKAELYKDIINA